MLRMPLELCLCAAFTAALLPLLRHAPSPAAHGQTVAAPKPTPRPMHSCCCLKPSAFDCALSRLPDALRELRLGIAFATSPCRSYRRACRCGGLGHTVVALPAALPRTRCASCAWGRRNDARLALPLELQCLDSGVRCTRQLDLGATSLRVLFCAWVTDPSISNEEIFEARFRQLLPDRDVPWRGSHLQSWEQLTTTAKVNI
ncbi:hypothetical protein JKP88DRAFT_287437 [Tribonema minus]|uniref:Uncharacterized protein n=1 Tax=Tribonema minus TaxID=303371 RepID=A0A835Z9E4_9STRA|nr:hypothetical protein JKP88DRAFT_287437 [Tribonema minus]